MPKLTICGGGNAAHVLMALAARAGWKVDVFAPLADEAERLRTGMAARGGMVARSGGLTIIGQVRHVSPDPAEVIPGSELVLLALPAFAHGPTLKAIAGYLDPGVALGALPARGGFDYQVFSSLDMSGLSLRIFGLQTLPWACRIVSFGQEVEILGTKAAVDLAAFPAGEVLDLAHLLSSLLDLKVTPVSSFLTLTLANTGQLIHPGIMYGLCRGQEEATFSPADIPLFYQGVDQDIAAILQAMSDDVQQLAGVLAAQLADFDAQEVIPLYEWIVRSYPYDIVDSSTLQSAFATNRAYTGLKVPTRPAGPNMLAVDFKVRYLAEDIPFGLVVLHGLAELVDVSTSHLDQVISWAQARLDRQYLIDESLSGSDLAETRAPQVYGIRTLAQLASSLLP